MPVAIAAPNRLAAEAGAEVAEAGGNAVDCALAASVVAMTTEPGICSLAGGAYLTIGPAHGHAVTIDANVEMPGRGLPPSRFGRGTFDIATAYGGGIDITIGHGSVATPGTPAGLVLAHDLHGRAPWREVLAPAIAAARTGFPLGRAASYYLDHVHETLFGWHDVSHAALHDGDGTLIPEGGTVVVDDLADTLEAFADHRGASFYHGEVAGRLVAEVQAHDGLLTAADLAAYRPLVRDATTVALDGWSVATNPPPAIGGAVLAALLTLLGGEIDHPWDREEIARMVTAQDLVLGQRVAHLDRAEDREAAARAFLERIDGEFRAALTSPSTVHVSATDDDGLSCAVTASAGYGSGVIARGTGLWLNNCLGEQELNRRGLHAWDPGERLPSNMAPTVARHPDGASLAAGSPGADRITTALAQTLLRFAGGADLAEAIAAPRVHVLHTPDGAVREVGYERGLPIPADLPGPGRAYEPHAMFFGGVTATLRRPDGHLEAAADPRRTGATAVAGPAAAGR